MKRLTIIVPQVLLGLAFLASAFSKLAGAAKQVRDHLEIAPWFWVATALVELAGAAGLLAGIRFPRLAMPAGLWMAALMVGAIASHLRVGDPLANTFPAAVLVVLALAVAALRAGAYGFEVRAAKSG